MKTLENLQEYLNHRIDIICNSPQRWLNDLKNLPTYEYFIKNCIEDKGGKYDFTVRRFVKENNIYQPSKVCNFENVIHNLPTVKTVTKHSIWMSTPFNFNSETTIHETT